MHSPHLSPHEVEGMKRLLIVLVAFAMWTVWATAALMFFLGVTPISVLLAGFAIVGVTPVLGLISRTWLGPWRDQPAL
jgi:hypothetical protein